MPRFFNPYVYGGQNNMQENGLNTMPTNCCEATKEQHSFGCGCEMPKCPTIYKECPPIVTCSKQVINQYHITKQPYIHTYHTEVVHHHITQNEFIPNYTCSEVHVSEPDNTMPNNM